MTPRALRSVGPWVLLGSFGIHAVALGALRRDGDGVLDARAAEVAVAVADVNPIALDLIVSPHLDSAELPAARYSPSAERKEVANPVQRQEARRAERKPTAATPSSGAPSPAEKTTPEPQVESPSSPQLAPPSPVEPAPVLHTYAAASEDGGGDTQAVPRYLQSMRARLIGAILLSPNTAAHEGTVILRVVVGRDGRVHDVEVVSGDADPVLRASALRAASRSAPFPAVPREFGPGERYAFRIPLRFTIQAAR